MVFIFFKWLRNNQKKTITWPMKILRNANISVHKCYGNIAMLIVFILLMAASFPQGELSHGDRLVAHGA